jgi:hypothetical protein
VCVSATSEGGVLLDSLQAKKGRGEGVERRSAVGRWPWGVQEHWAGAARRACARGRQKGLGWAQRNADSAGWRRGVAWGGAPSDRERVVVGGAEHRSKARGRRRKKTGMQM